MSRWLLALLLTLLLPSYGFAAQGMERSMENQCQAQAQFLEILEPANASAAIPAELGAGATHGDSLLDAPELFATLPAAAMPALPAAAPQRLGLTGLPAPVLEGPCRPPRASR